MIQRKIDVLGNVTGYFDTEAKAWVSERAFDETTDERGKVLDPNATQASVDARANEVATSEDVAGPGDEEEEEGEGEEVTE